MLDRSLVPQGLPSVALSLNRPSRYECIAFYSKTVLRLHYTCGTTQGDAFDTLTATPPSYRFIDLKGTGLDSQ